MSITHNKNLNPWLNVLINCVSARSAPQIMFIKGECTFLLLNFLKIGSIIRLSNYFANSSLAIFSVVVPRFFSKTL